MEMRELKIKLEMLSNTMLDLIETFETETNMQLDTIELIRSRNVSGRNPILGVEVKTTISMVKMIN